MDERNFLQWKDQDFPPNTTVIFSGVNDQVLQLFHRLLAIDIQQRPVIIFSEMSTEKKGLLAQCLKKHNFFVVANGDGSNDVAMMKNADMVLAHVTEEGRYALGVEQFVDLSDKQLQGILKSNRSFYEIFDIHERHSLFINAFAPLANSQEKPSIALLLKSSKMSFELARSIGLGVVDIPGLHWWGVGFDLAWLWIAFDAINATVNLPMDNQNLDESHFSTVCLVTSLSFAVLSSAMLYALSGESTNLTWMVLVLSFLPLLLRSIFSGFGYLQEKVIIERENEESSLEEPARVLPSQKGITQVMSTFFSPQKDKSVNVSRAMQTESSASISPYPLGFGKE
jgi:magnesium-transporting ATPase (P-type)